MMLLVLELTVEEEGPPNEVTLEEEELKVVLGGGGGGGEVLEKMLVLLMEEVKSFFKSLDFFSVALFMSIVLDDLMMVDPDSVEIVELDSSLNEVEELGPLVDVTLDDEVELKLVFGGGGGEVLEKTLVLLVEDVKSFLSFFAVALLMSIVLEDL